MLWIWGLWIVCVPGSMALLTARHLAAIKLRCATDYGIFLLFWLPGAVLASVAVAAITWLWRDLPTAAAAFGATTLLGSVALGIYSALIGRAELRASRA